VDCERGKRAKAAAEGKSLSTGYIADYGLIQRVHEHEDCTFGIRSCYIRKFSCNNNFSFGFAVARLAAQRLKGFPEAGGRDERLGDRGVIENGDCTPKKHNSGIRRLSEMLCRVRGL